ncbi:chromosome segregation protein SMC [Thalassotalea euphylliae]|uniref:Chromosome partition protein Smc n=1 Tax=Thalassotalea euphylliae TaxID=1655234 RepID=A0A3E0TZ83_9GAMM|nr:chromosome segregation protein SMC [Thalassotalea euphylliae]REL29966.1 chromosome segregation protein SMC [Thalassotalea euphylliae]
MRLKQIKLAGFKSFVDVTKVPFPHQMTAIVGPNGCGKSNIIDAVRWVLGESSAKNLRGDAMTDVIFNGSAERKPIGQASVELIFETQGEGTQDLPTNNFHLAANLAERNEVAIRRTVNRDGQNLYYLNGCKCRKKDITDVFLGSGLGPKSYAIIEQGMISRLIESKPQELRVFVEEAAGVSKYKERRRETELKLGHTSDNLSRLADISQEIGIHLNVLDQQAQQAGQYRKLKAQERELKSIIATVKYQSAQKQLDKLNTVIAELNVHMAEAKNALGEQKLALSKQEQAIEHDYKTLSDAQHTLTSTNQEHSRYQQELATAQHLLSNNEKQVARYLQKQQDIVAKSEQYHQEIARWQEKLAALAPQTLAAEQALVSAKAELLNLEQQVASQEQLVQMQSRERLAAQEQRLAQQEAQLASQELLAKLTAQLEAKQLQFKELNEQPVADLSALTEQIQRLKDQITNSQAQLNAQAQSNNQLEQDIKQAELALADNKQLQLSFNLQLAQLTKQLAVKEEWQSECEHWLTAQGITEFNSYREAISVDKNWQAAVDKVLGQWLDAYLLSADNFQLISANISNTLESSAIDSQSCFHDNSQSDSKNSSQNNEHKAAERFWFINQENLEQHANIGSLASKVTTHLGFVPLLNQVKVAEDEASLQAMLASVDTLTDEQYIISADGTLWSRAILSKGRASQGINRLTLQYEYDELNQQITELSPIVDAQSEKLKQLQGQQQSLAKQSTVIANQLAEQKLALQKAQSEYDFAQSQVDQRNRQLASLSQELGKLTLEHQSAISTLEQSKAGQASEALSAEAIEQSEQALRALQEQLAALIAQKHSKQQALNDAQQQLQQLQLQHQQHSLSLRQSELQLAHTSEQRHSTDDQLSHYQQELAQLPKTATLEQQVVAANESVEKAKVKLASAELQLDESKAKKSQLAQQISQLETKVNQHNDTAHQQALKKEQLVFELNAAKESLSELKELNQQQVFGEPTGSVASYQQQLKQVQRQLGELGAVNLAAIDEFQLQQTRKNQIDLQIEDLTQAVATLESAIAKIDKESRQKFKTTFEQINQGFSALFPKVFGGGQAYLALTSDDLLDTGVTIMARPPGKKNSTIHLLSGGEKALTALSLVFAIFRLTPAPFCMLDEVDAPLDDANVERFCNLVGEMSKTVQFIYISHNKIAMEMASHLTGVTMMEPGVSRMVSVDIDEAIAMAEVS